MNAVMHILRYLKSAPRKGIIFSKNIGEQSIDLYTNADWAGDKGDRRSTSRYFTFVSGNLVTWMSKKQVRSSGDTELRGMVLGICEGLWLK